MKSGLFLLAIFISIFVIISMGFSSCTSSETILSASCDDFMKLQPNAVITKQIEIPVNGTLDVELCSNASTGFKWLEVAVIGDFKVMQQVNHSVTAPDSKGIVGAPGKETWVFKALKAGQCTISNEYSQPWQGGTKGSWKYIINVTVK